MSACWSAPGTHQVLQLRYLFVQAVDVLQTQNTEDTDYRELLFLIIHAKFHGMLIIKLTCLIMYVSSSISTALSSNRDFLFATIRSKQHHIESVHWMIRNKGNFDNILNDTVIKVTLTNGELFQFGKCIAQVFSNSPTRHREM